MPSLAVLPRRAKRARSHDKAPERKRCSRSDCAAAPTCYGLAAAGPRSMGADEMPNLTQEGLRAVSDIAARHGFSAEAALSLVDSLAQGQGAQAQFSHPELGGMGQWSRGGMIMIGDMFNQGLKYRVDALCNDLSALLGQQPSIHAPAAQSQSQSGGYSSFLGGTAPWWPAELGQPSSSGGQNDMRYAFFPGARRLAIQQGGRTLVYDSGDHQFQGVSQQQVGGQSLTFTSQHGTVRAADLPLVSGEASAAAANPPRPAQTFASQPAAQDLWTPPPSSRRGSEASPPPRAASNAGEGSSVGADDIVRTIKSLAALRQEGILTEEEFAAKKAELLGRI